MFHRIHAADFKDIRLMAIMTACRPAIAADDDYRAHQHDYRRHLPFMVSAHRR